MNKIIIHFCIMYNDESIELVLDNRLSLKDNFMLFKDHPEIMLLASKQIMAKKGQYVLNIDTPLSTFNLRDFTRLYVY